MSANIIKFPGGNNEIPPDQIILVCQECGCCTFYLDATPQIECAHCHNIIAPDSVEWRTLIAVTPPVPEVLPDNSETFTIIDYRDEKYAILRTIKRIEEFNNEKTLRFAAGLREDGNFTSWSGARNSQEQEWIIRTLHKLIEQLQSTIFRSENNEPQDHE